MQILTFVFDSLLNKNRYVKKNIFSVKTLFYEKTLPSTSVTKLKPYA